MTNKLKKIINELNEIIVKNDFNLNAIEIKNTKANTIAIIFDETKDFKKQWYFVELKEASLKNFIEELENTMNLENLDETAIFMYRSLRKTPISLKETIDKTEERRKTLMSFTKILSNSIIK